MRESPFRVEVIGRLGEDPRAIDAHGRAMAAAVVGVELACLGGGESVYRLRVVAYGARAAVLMRHGAGTLVRVCGHVRLARWQINRQQLQVVAESIEAAPEVAS